MDDRVSIAKIVKTRGIRGELAADVLTDFPERFAKLQRVFLSVGERSFEERIERFWFHKNRVILKFEGRNRPEDVQELIGADVWVPADERVQPPKDTFFDSDLVGCAVIQEGRELGRVDGVLRVGGGVSNLIVLDSQGREFMVPFVGEFVGEVSLARRSIEVQLPEGLTDLAVDRKSRNA